MTEYVVFDLDGTIANIDHRRALVEKLPKDWDAFYQKCKDDVPVTHVIRMMMLLAGAGYRIHIWSGRSDIVMPETKAWLADYGVPYHQLMMRPADDYTPDVKLKEKWLSLQMQYPAWVFDDRDSVVDMWRRRGIPCYQVARGSF
jgi:hypothetical protein